MSNKNSKDMYNAQILKALKKLFKTAAFMEPVFPSSKSVKEISRKMAKNRGVTGGRTKSDQDKKKSGGKVSKKVSRKK